MDAAATAIRENNVEVLRALTTCPEAQDYLAYRTPLEGGNLLHEAVHCSRVECVEYLVQHFPYLAKEPDDTKNYPIHVACEFKKSLKIVELLLKVEDTVNAKGSCNQTPLHAAVRFEYSQTEFIGKDPNKITYLVNLIHLLVKKGANIDSRDSSGYTPLHLSIADSEADVSCFKLLMDLGADVELRDVCSCDPLSTAAIHGNCHIIKLLVKKCPGLVNSSARLNYSPLLFASQYACEYCVELLLINKADVFHVANDGTTCLLAATKGGKVRNFAMLLSYGADPSQETDHSTPLTMACLLNHWEIVEMILSHESMDNYKVIRSCEDPVNTWHPLICAVKSRSPKILKLMLQRRDFVDRSVSAKGTDFFTAFFNYSRFSIVSCLLSHNVGANKDGEEMLEMLLKENFPINSEYGSIPALTVLLSNFHENHAASVIRMMRRLIAYGADIHDMSLPINDWPFHDSHTVREVRNTLKVPDALVIAFHADNFEAVKILLPFWPQVPLFLLLMRPSICSHRLVTWYNLLIKYGWVNGVKESQTLCKFLRKRTMSTSAWQHLQLNFKNPSSLQTLARFAARKYLAPLIGGNGKYLPDLIDSVRLPPQLVAYMKLE